MPGGREGAPAPHARAIDALSAALPSLSPPLRISVSAAAEEFRRVSSNGALVPWRNSVAPYMTEPMDMTDSRRFRGVVFVGPARSVKSESLINNVIIHRIKCRPRPMRLIAPDQNAAREYSLSKLDSALAASKDVRSHLLPGRFSDTIFEKRFAGGMRLTIGWPVPSQFAMVDIPDMMLTDFDRMPEDVGGEGDPFILAMKRTQTFGTLGMTIAESSPSRMVDDDSWRPPAEAPHLAPPCTGILSHYNSGTRARRYWHCDGCSLPFEPDFTRLDYPKRGDPYARGRGAVMVCPHCGGVHEQGRRRDLEAAGVWLHEAADGQLVTIDRAVRETDIVSYWLKGPSAVFQSWAEIVGKYLSAVETFAATGSEQALKSTVNTDQALTYTPRAISDEADLSAERLRDKPVHGTAGTVPAAARFLTVQVDVQTNRFVVQVDAWGVGLERWMIDRFDIHAAPASSPGAAGRAIAPPQYSEDWVALDALFDRLYPVEGAAASLKPVAVIVDSGGAPGTTQNAYKWWRRARKAFGKRRVFILKGLPGVNREPRAMLREPEKVEQKRATKAQPRRSGTVEVVFAATDRLKDEVAVSLLRREPGPGAYHLTAGLSDVVPVELSAERRTADGWVAKQGQRRNEALDLSVYGRALVLILKGEAINWDRPPPFAAPLNDNPFAVVTDAPAVPVRAAVPRPVETAAPVAQPAAAPVRRGRRQRSGGY